MRVQSGGVLGGWTWEGPLRGEGPWRGRQRSGWAEYLRRRKTASTGVAWSRTVSGGKGAKTRQMWWISRPAIKVAHRGPSGGQEQIHIPICSCIKKGHPEAQRCLGACHRLPGGPSIKSSGSLPLVSPLPSHTISHIRFSLWRLAFPQSCRSHLPPFAG